MWRSVLAELRRLGPRKIAIIVVLGAIAVVFAWGNHTSDSAASGATLPRTALVSTAAHVRDGVIGRHTP